MRSRPTEIDDPTNRLVTPSELLVWWISFGHVRLVSSSGGPAIREQISSLTNSLGSIMSFSGKLSNPDSAITVDQRSTIVKMLDSKAVVLADEATDYVGDPILFEDDSVVTFGDLAQWEPRAEGSGRHFPVVCGLTKGQASGVIASLIQYPNRPKADNGNRPKATKAVKSQPAKPVQAETEGSLKDELRSMITDVVSGMLGDLLPKAAEPAKPVPAEGHVKIAKPAKPVEVKAITVEDGAILEIAGDHFVVTIGKNGRPYLAKAEV